MTDLVEVVEQSLGPAPEIGPGPEAPTPTRPPRFASFDGLRAIAALTTVGVHTAFVSGLTVRNRAVGHYTSRLEIGVSVFFLISGFLLYRPFLVAHLAGANRPSASGFWLRRALRILPAYWLALFVVTSVFHSGPGIGPGGWRAYVIHYLFLQVYFPSQEFHGILAAWSLCVEATFYLFVPCYAALIGRRRTTRTARQSMHRELVGLGGMVLVSLLWRFVVIHLTPASSHRYYGVMLNWLPAFLDLFALGMGLALASAWMHQHANEPRWLSARWFPWVSWSIAGACFWAVSNIGIPLSPIYRESNLDLVRQALYGLFALFLLLPAVFGPQHRGLIRRFLQCWPVASLGVVSYGVYLWHEGWMYQIVVQGHFHLFNLEFWAFFLSVLALAVGSASLSYFVVEKPVLRLKSSIGWWRQADRRPPAVAAGALSAGPASSGGAAMPDELHQPVGTQ